jgi:hypothetical protein
MKKILFFLFLSFTLFLHAQKQDCCKTTLDRTKLPSTSLKELSNEYKRLKLLPNNCCNHYNSDFQLIMNECGYQIKKKKLSKRKIIGYLGKPDADSMPVEYRSYLKIGEKEEVLIYFWRNWHDFMYIYLKNGKVKKLDWFYAYE